MPTLPVEACVAAREITEPRLSAAGDMVAYASSQPGRVELVVQALDGHGHSVGDPRVVTSTPAPRTGRGGGGGCWCWSADGGAIVYAALDGDLWWQPLAGGPPHRLTQVGDGRAAQAPVATPDGRSVVFVVDQSEVWSVSVVDRASSRLDDAAADFCFDPCVATDSARVAWIEWDIPDMAWDAARVAVRAVDGGAIERRRPAHSVQQARWMPDGSLLSIRDDHGWLNVWSDDSPLIDDQVEHAGPTWGHGQCSYAASPDGESVVFTRNEQGFGRLCLFDRAQATVVELGRGVHAQVSWAGHLVAALRSGARTPPEVVVYDLSVEPPSRTTIAVGPLFPWDRESLVEPELLEVPTPDGGVVPCRWYPAAHVDTRAHVDIGEHGATPRTLCWIHGGPTDQWQVSFMPRLEYYRSRGWDIVVPDHRGSTGHGREFQQALNGRWGELDVDDVAAVLRFVYETGRGTAARTALMGGSAGGFTVLGVIAHHPGLVCAAAVSYPVADLADLEQRSHRFERHSVWRLVAKPGESAEGDRLLRDRSPIHLAAQITVPVLLAHGSDDPVVPVSQSTMLVERITAAGGRADLVVYADEGHGFRAPEHQIDDYRRTEAFLELHVPVKPHQG